MPLKYQVEIDSNNISFVSKLLHHMQSINAFTEANYEFVLDDRIELESKPNLLFYPKEDVFFFFNEHRMCFSYRKDNKSSNFNFHTIRFDVSIVSTDDGFNVLKEFLLMLDKMTLREAAKNELCKYVWSKEEIWKYSQQFRRRKLETIYMEDRDKIVDALEKFINDESLSEMYNELDIPLKKIFLFHGAPGTGKTSLIRALASHFNYNISLVKNISEMDDSNLESMLSSLKKKSFLVLEDVDCLFNSNQERQMNVKTNISFSGFLNLLDGIAKYEKLIVFITTNFVEKLDPAFKRRVDMFVKFDSMKVPQIKDMYLKFFKNSDEESENFRLFMGKIKHKKITANALEKYFIQCVLEELTPADHIQLLDEYSDMVSGRKEAPTHMYS